MSETRYWLDLFTPDTWQEIGQVNYEVTGFRASRKAHAEKVTAGDLFLCYLTGKSRFVGILEALSGSYWDETPIWASDPFPVRLKTRLVCRVPEDTGLHLHDVVEQSQHQRSWSGYYRGSPQRLPDDDGRFIAARLEEMSGEVQDAGPPLKLEVGGDEPPDETAGTEPAATDHQRIQHRLLDLGRSLGFDLWVARNDRNATYGGERFDDMTVDELPIRFDDTTRRTIELIDVLWLQENRIEAAFEIESTTSIFSGLLRMADLLAMQPNIDIPLFIVAPDERRQAVFREIRRPVFSSLPTPLARACRYISFQRLENEIDALGSRVRHLRPTFLDEIAEHAR